MREYRDT